MKISLNCSSFEFSMDSFLAIDSCGNCEPSGTFDTSCGSMSERWLVDQFSNKLDWLTGSVLGNDFWDWDTNGGSVDGIVSKLVNNFSDIEGLLRSETSFESGVDSPFSEVTLEGSSIWISDWEGNWSWPL